MYRPRQICEPCGVKLPPRNKALKDVTVREIAAMTEKQAKEMLSYLAGYGIDKDAEDFRRVWNLALKACCSPAAVSP